MKLCGALLILLSSLAAALSLLGEERKKQRSLAALRQGLLTLRGAIAERQTPLPEAFRTLAGEAEDKTVRAFFTVLTRNMESLGERSFSALWRDAAEALGPLGGETAERLAALGGQLGGRELERQCAALDKCAEVLEGQLAQAAARRAERRRMTLGLSLSLGSFLIILLL